jgi:hypothetical protein
MSQDVWKLRCQIAQVPLYYCRHDLKYIKKYNWWNIHLTDWLVFNVNFYQYFSYIVASWPFGSDGLKMKYEYQDILLQFKIWDYLDMMFKNIWYLNTTDIFPIADLILKLYVCIHSYFPYVFIHSYFPYNWQNGIWSSMSKEKDNKFEYNFLV